MPLMSGKSKKAFSKNVATEMEHGKPQKQALAISYAVQRRKKKASGGAVQSGSKDMNMAEGGSISASNEKRPMPDDIHDDSESVSKNRGNKPSRNDSWTDRPTEAQAVANDVRGKRLPIKRPRMVPTNAFSTRLYDEEGNLQESDKPGPYGEQPTKWHDEEDAKKSGHPVRDMEDEHSTHRKPYAEGGKVKSDLDHGQKRGPQGYPKYQEQAQNEKGINTPVSGVTAYPGGKGTSRAGDYTKDTYAGKPTFSGKDHPAKAEHRKVLEEIRSMPKPKLAEGGRIEESDYNHSPNKYEDDLTDLPPSEDEGDRVAMSDDEAGQDRSGPAVPDMEDEHSNGRKPYADGGEIGRSADDSEDQPEQEENEEHHNSIAAAIMARRDRLHAEIDSGAHDMDSAVRMADGGILSHDSIYSDDSDVADLSRNHDEDANEEDQLSFNALRKENYNTSNLDVDNDVDGNQIGDEEESDSENKHDMISSIRRKMRMKRQFNQD